MAKGRKVNNVIGSMTEEQFELLIPFEENMRLMLERGYCRNIKLEERKLLHSIYNTIFSKPQNTGCSNCIKEMFLALATPYFNFKKEPILEPKIDEVELEVTEEEIVPKNTIKSGKKEVLNEQQD